MMKFLLTPGSLFVLTGLVLWWLRLRGRLENRPILHWLGPVLVPTGVSFWIPMWLWEDTALLLALTLAIMGLNSLTQKHFGQTLWRFFRSLPDHWAKLSGW